MSSRRLERFAGVMVLATALSFLGCQAAADQGQKVPITTSSDVALKSFMQGRDLQEKLRLQESRQHFQKAIAKDPNFAMAHLYLSFTQPSAKEFFESLNNAVALTGKISEGERIWVLGVEAGVNGDPTRQRENFTKLVEMYPKDERTHNLLAGHHFGQQQYDQAIEHYEHAISINPKFSQPYNQLGYAYRFLEKYDESERTFKKYIEVIPDDPNPYDSYAELLLKIGKYDASIENYRKALQINSNFPASHIGIATNYNLKGEHANARKELQRLYEKALDDGQRRAALFAMTVSYVDEGEMKEALAILQKQYSIAREINDSAAMAGDLANMAQIQLELGYPDKAMQKFNESLEVMRESNLSKEQKDLAEQGHLFNMAQVALEKGDLKAARKSATEYKKQAEARNNRFQIWAAYQLTGRIALASKNFADAVSDFQQSNLQNPRNIYRLALAYEGQGDNYKAEEMFRKAENFNALNSLPYAYMRNQHKKMMSAK